MNKSKHFRPALQFHCFKGFWGFWKYLFFLKTHISRFSFNFYSQFPSAWKLKGLLDDLNTLTALD